MSVSELKKKGMEEEEEEMVFLPTLPVFMEKEQEEKGGATRGTAYHRVLQFLPFERASVFRRAKWASGIRMSGF